VGDILSHVLMDVVIFPLWSSLQTLAGSVPTSADSTSPTESLGQQESVKLHSATEPSQTWSDWNCRECRDDTSGCGRICHAM